MAKRKRAIEKAQEQAKPRGIDWRGWLPIIVILVLSVAVYTQVGDFGFAVIDDADYVSHNGYVREGPAPQGILWALTARHASNWHPLTWISHMLDCRLFGLDPGKHHLTNLVFHLANALLLFVVLRRMTGSIWRSSFVTGLFALHPLHVESVAWISERKDVLSTFFMLLAILAYVRCTEKPGVGRWVLVSIVFGLGLMAKPMLVSLPIILLLLDYWPLRRWQLGLGKLLMEKTPLFLLSVASCAVTFLAQRSGGAVQELADFPLTVRIANAIVSYASYLGKMILPTNLGPLYPHPGNTLPVWTVVISTAVLLVLTMTAATLRRKAPYLIVGWLFYIITLLPVIGLVQVGNEGMADRYTYVPLMGIFIAIFWLVPDTLSRISARSRRIGLRIAGCAVIVALSTLTYQQAGTWRDTDSFTRQMLKATHNHPLSRLKEAKFLSQEGRLEEAEVFMAELVEDYPSLPEVRNGYGCLLGDLKRHNEAVLQFREAIRLRPDYAAAYSNLGLEYESAGKLDEALRWCRKAVGIAPKTAQWRANLAHVLATLQRYEESAAEYRRALAIRPDTPGAESDLGMVLYNNDDAEGGIRHLRRAVRANPDDGLSRLRLGTMLHYEGHHTEAIEHLRAATELQPASADAHGTLAMALNAAGHTEEAQQELELAQRYGAKP